MLQYKTLCVYLLCSKRGISKNGVLLIKHRALKILSLFRKSPNYEQLKGNRQKRSRRSYIRTIQVYYVTFTAWAIVYYLSCGCLAIPLSR
jgi:hypothetical protein